MADKRLTKFSDPNFIQNASIKEREKYAEIIGNAWVEEAKNPVSIDTIGNKKTPPLVLPPPPVHKPVMVQNKKGEYVTNEDWGNWFSGVHTARASWMQTLIDPRRNLDAECGYPTMILPKQHRFMYDREGIGTRVVDIYPDESWALTPEIYENENPKSNTAFDESWEILGESDNDPLHYIHRQDRMSRIGRYGPLLFGVADGRDLSEPVSGIDPMGADKRGKGTKYGINFLRPFDEMYAQILSYEQNTNSPRFGQPLYYHMMFADPRVGTPGIAQTAPTAVASRVVHWTRVQHFCDNREGSEVFGVPAMQSTFNRLCDCRKILGGSGEMFWKGGFPGYSFELNPDLIQAGVAPDTASIKTQMENYANGMQRYISVVGMHTNSLAPQVADPMGHLNANLQAIALSIGVPLRVFMGSEQAQLASGQDLKTWNRRLSRRHNRYLTPKVIRPFINRLIAYGTLEPPKKGRYKCIWPDINVPSETERADIADKMAAGLMKYIIGGVYQVCPPIEFFTLILGLSEDKAKIMAGAAKKWMASPDFKIKNPNEKPAMTGSANQRGTGMTN